ncbi:hypothetical protein [Streptomyces sp. NPDC002845]
MTTTATTGPDGPAAPDLTAPDLATPGTPMRGTTRSDLAPPGTPGSGPTASAFAAPGLNGSGPTTADLTGLDLAATGTTSPAPTTPATPGSGPAAPDFAPPELNGSGPTTADLTSPGAPGTPGVISPYAVHGSALSVIALGKPNDSLLTVIIVAVVVLLLLFLLLRHVIRKRGGWRRFRRRVGRELTLTRRAFGEPLRAYRRHRRGVRALARQLAAPRNGLLVRRLLDAAGGALADAPGAVPYAVRTEPGRAAVQIAARRLPEPPAPWETSDETGPQRWELPLAEEDTLPEARPRSGTHARPLPVAVGMADHACVHLDLAAGPRLITVEGDLGARTRLLQALAAQLDRPGSGASVIVADGVHPQHRGQRLDTALRELEAAASEPEGIAEAREPGEPGEIGQARGTGESGGIGESGRAATTVVVCAAPSPEQARRLSALAASGAVVCLADGRVAGHSWALRVDARGRVVAPELGLDADSAPLGIAVAAAVRADRRRLRREASPRRGTATPRRPRSQGPGSPERRARELQESRSRQEADDLQETRQEPTPRTTATATAPPRTTTGPDLLAEPDAARERTTAASSGRRED